MSKMRLLNTHSYTSERRGYEADNERQVRRERNKAYTKRRKNVNENHRATWPGRRGTGRKHVDGQSKTPSRATTAARGGEAKLYQRKREKNHIVLCRSRRGKITHNAAGPEGGGRQDER